MHVLGQVCASKHAGSLDGCPAICVQPSTLTGALQRSCVFRTKGNTDTNKVEAALENKVDGLVVYNSGNNIDLNTGAINGTNVYYMSVYLKQRESIAVNGTATQSETTAPQWYVEASRAIDGNVNGHWSGGNGSVTHTAGVNPWWQVDLGSN